MSMGTKKWRKERVPERMSGAICWALDRENSGVRAWWGAPRQRKGNGSQAAWESKQQSDLANWTRRASNGQRGKLENAKVNVIEKMEVGRVLYETFCKILRLKICGLVKLLAAEKEAERMKIHKLPPAIEDLRNHSDEQMLELRLLLNSGETGRADERRPGFFEMEGIH